MNETPKPLTQLVRRFRSAASGFWYENPHLAGKIDAVELNGQILERNENESALEWIRRAGQWARLIHLENK